MNITTRLGLALVFMGLVGGCSTPKVIETTKLSDRDLSCESLKDEFKQAEQAKKEAEDVKGVTGTNTMAAIFFPVGGSFTVRATKKHQNHLRVVFSFASISL